MDEAPVAPLPKLLEPNVGVVLLPTAVAAEAPKPPNVVVVPDDAAGLPNMGLTAAAADAAGDPNTGPLLVWAAGVGAGFAAALKLNAGEDCSAGFEAPVKLNADEAPPLAAAPKIDDVLPLVAGAGWGAPNEPNVAVVGLSAVAPKLGITLAAGWLLL